MSDNYRRFLARRDELLSEKPNQSVRGFCVDIVELLELIAVHGTSGIMGDARKRAAYIDRLEHRIGNALKEQRS